MLNNQDPSTRHLLIIIGVAFGILLVLSAVPWGNITGNRLKDFNLFEDLMPAEPAVAGLASTNTVVDPELEELMAQNAVVPDSLAADTLTIDSLAMDSVAIAAEISASAPVVDGIVAIENYGSEAPLSKFKEALRHVGERRVRIAVIGDSYIEGDIFTSKLRDILQQRYGGCGVGFMAMHSDIPGFRHTVGQSDNGWTMHDIRTMSRRDSVRTLSADYATAAGAASTTFRGRDKYDTTKRWQSTRFVFIAPAAGTVSITAPDSLVATMEVEPSAEPQVLTLDANVGKATIKSTVPGLKALGAYLDGTVGVQVDCMSVRGNSGLSIRRLNGALCRDMAENADYDLIILEYGMNVVNAQETDYDSYMQSMVKAVAHLQECYPNADLLIMGVGDRGVKAGTELVSLPTIEAMTKAQRGIARQTGSLFWDTRAAMGGDKAVKDWRKRKLVNADYIHLNHQGGDELAKLFDKSLQLSLDE